MRDRETRVAFLAECERIGKANPGMNTTDIAEAAMARVASPAYLGATVIPFRRLSSDEIRRLTPAQARAMRPQLERQLAENEAVLRAMPEQTEVCASLRDRSVRPAGPAWRWITEKGQWCFVALDPREHSAAQQGQTTPEVMTLREYESRRARWNPTADEKLALERQYTAWRHPEGFYMFDGNRIEIVDGGPEAA